MRFKSAPTAAVVLSLMITAGLSLDCDPISADYCELSYPDGSCSDEGARPIMSASACDAAAEQASYRYYGTILSSSDPAYCFSYQGYYGTYVKFNTYYEVDSGPIGTVDNVICEACKSSSVNGKGQSLSLHTFFLSGTFWFCPQRTSSIFAIS